MLPALLLIAAALPQPLDRLGAVEVSLSRECSPACPLRLRQGKSELLVSDLALPPGPARKENGQWTVGNAILTLQPLRLGARAAGVLIGVLRVPEGEGLAMGAWRLVVAGSD